MFLLYPAPEKSSSAAHRALVDSRDYLQINTVHLHSVCYRWRGLCSRWFECLYVWSWHFGCGERSEKGADRPVSFGQTSAHISCSYQARGEDSLGLLGFSAVWVSLRALCKTKPVILSDLCVFYRVIFRFRAHLVIPQTAALCALITSQLQAALNLWEHSWILNCFWGFESVKPAVDIKNMRCLPSGISQIYPSWFYPCSWRSSPQTWRWTLQRCRRRPLFWWTCRLLQSRRPPWRTPPLLGSAGTPGTGLQGGCSPKSSEVGYYTSESAHLSWNSSIMSSGRAIYKY